LSKVNKNDFFRLISRYKFINLKNNYAFNYKKAGKKKDLKIISRGIKPKKHFKASEYCGKVKTKVGAVKVQGKLRDEWN